MRSPKEELFLDLIDKQGEHKEIVVYFDNGMQMGGKVSKNTLGYEGMFELATEVWVGEGAGPLPAMPGILASRRPEKKQTVTFQFSIDDVTVFSLSENPFRRMEAAERPKGLSRAELEELGIEPSP